MKQVKQPRAICYYLLLVAAMDCEILGAKELKKLLMKFNMQLILYQLVYNTSSK